MPHTLPLMSSKRILITAFTLTTACLGLLVYSALNITASTLEKASISVQNQYWKQHHLINMSIAGQQRTISLEHMILEDDPFLKDEALMIFYRAGRDYGIHRQQLDALTKPNAHETQLLSEIQDLANQIGPLQNHIAELSMNNENQEAKTLLLQQQFSFLEKFTHKVNAFSAYQSQEIESAIKHAKQMNDDLMKRIILLAAGLVLISMMFSILLSRKFNKINLLLQESNQSLEHEVQVRTQQLIETQSHLIQQNAILEQLSTTDPLTQLYNRLKIEQILEEIYTEYQTHQTPYCVLLIDLDHFKIINDNHGHACGDLVLQSFADLLKKSFSAPHAIGRWGGEEFIVILKGCDREAAFDLAEQFRITVENHHFAQVKQVTQSSGIACVTHAENNEKLIHQADIALYESKNQGRNCVTLSTQHLKDEQQALWDLGL